MNSYEILKEKKNWLESAFALKTQIFQAKNMLDVSVHPYFQGWLKTKDSQRSGAAVRDEISRN